jgi:hypothetical protein
MDKMYNVEKIDFDEDNMIIKINGKLHTFPLAQSSTKLRSDGSINKVTFNKIVECNDDSTAGLSDFPIRLRYLLARPG